MRWSVGSTVYCHQLLSPLSLSWWVTTPRAIKSGTSTASQGPSCWKREKDDSEWGNQHDSLMPGWCWPGWRSESFFSCFPNCRLKCHVHLKKMKKRFKIILKIKTMPDHLPLSSAESFAFTPVLNLRGDTNFTKTVVWIVLPLPQKGPHSCTLLGPGWSHIPSLSGSSVFSRVKYPCWCPDDKTLNADLNPSLSGSSVFPRVK